MMHNMQLQLQDSVDRLHTQHTDHNLNPYIVIKLMDRENHQNTPYSFEELKSSIDKMREIVISLN